MLSVVCVNNISIVSYLRSRVWDLLLDLYVARTENRQVSTTSACLAANVPPTTGLRCIERLERKALVTRSPNAGDSRLTIIAISDSAFEKLTTLLRRLGGVHGRTLSRRP